MDDRAAHSVWTVVRRGEEVRDAERRVGAAATVRAGVGDGASI
jgi:hypothetical protein